MKEKLPYNPCPMNEPSEEEGCERQLNEFGTYEVQKTADTDNYFPAIAQGAPKNSCFAISQDDKAYKESHRN